MIDSDELAELRDAFLEEAIELLDESEQLYMSLEDDHSEPTLDHIFRNAHSLKGSSNALGLTLIGEFTHELEHFLLKLKRNELSPTEQVVSLLLKCNDFLTNQVRAGGEDQSQVSAGDELKTQLTNFVEQDGDPASSDAEPEFGAATSQVTESESEQGDEPMQLVDDPYGSPENSALENIPDASAFEQEEPEESSGQLNTDDAQQTEQFSAEAEQPAINADLLADFHRDFPDPKPSATMIPEPAAQANSEGDGIKAISTSQSSTVQEGSFEKESSNLEGNKAQAAPNANKSANKNSLERTDKAQTKVYDEKIKVSLQKIESLLNYVGEMTILQQVINEHSSSTNSRELNQSIAQLGKIAKEVQDTAMSLRLVPVKPAFQKISRIIRDTSNVLNKKINFHQVGEDIEIDKTILDLISDPLVHLIRNSCDHGIESAEVRSEKNKELSGNITLAAVHEDGKLVFYVEDDGAGLDPEKIRQSAIAKKIITASSTISDEEVQNLIFHPGFSTAAKVTDISGRGVGMDVVKTNIEKLSGQIQVTSEVGKGSQIKITLPLTLAIIEAIIVQVKGDKFAIPLAHVNESIKIDPKECSESNVLGSILTLRGENIPVFDLSQISTTNIKTAAGAKQNEKIAIISRGPLGPRAVLVDDILSKQQIVVKSIGKEISHIPYFTGTTILGDGNPALILEVTKLTQKLVNKNSFSHLELVTDNQKGKAA